MGPTVTSSPVPPSHGAGAAKRCLVLPQARARGSHVLSPRGHGSVPAGRERLCAGHQPHN